MLLTLEQFAPEGLPASRQDNAHTITLPFGNDLLARVPGLRFTSGYRSAARNRAVGGVANSYHVKALAADFVSLTGKYPESLLAAVREVARRHGFSILLHDAGSGLHIHCEYEPQTVSAAELQTVFAAEKPGLFDGFDWWQWAFVASGCIVVWWLIDE